ncbi:MAG: N-acetylmuramoyl-L-alanine amidase [Acidobacteriota bacterium]|nr:N-acetylmuramoyl-L-alanine amidase [Acidobacteriota bacterium]
MRSRPQAQRTELSPWEAAERARETLEAVPAESRTKADYELALEGFRSIYHNSPRDLHAAGAVNAVAELLAEQGRTLHDTKSLQDAIGQYEFLRAQYPGSSLRVGALLAEGQIYAEDLGDSRSARARYQQLMKQYPQSGLAAQARAALAQLDSAPAPAAPPTAQPAPAAAESQRSPLASNLIGLPSHETGTASSRATLAPMPATRATTPVVDEKASEEAVEAAASAPRERGKRHSGPAVVSGIRHWSTPDYTRVAIDLGQDVKYEAAQVPRPDRIYFDLHNTHLAHELAGKSFTVTDGGILRRIRAAQFNDDVTRVVLDVSNVAQYSAFLLPNPYRLIIDIHGATRPTAVAAANVAAAGPAEVPGSAEKLPRPDGAHDASGHDSVATPAAAPSAKDVAAKDATGKESVTHDAGRPVPNTVSTRGGANSTEIASLSAQPGKVRATSEPTSQPIAAVVKDSDSAPAPVSNSLSRKGHRGKPADQAAPAHAAVPTADGETSLVRALGLKIGRIVIDAGHGGHDSGTLGVDGLEEKDVVLDVALRLGKLLQDRLGADVVYTRSDDTFIPLEQRTAIANKAQADLFLSIHANSSSDPTARGVETYYLNFTSSPDALQTAARENAVSDQSIHQLSDLVKKIALKDKIEESREFATDVQQGLYGGLQRGNVGLRNRGVKKAPFVVLIGASMPSILAEISFVTNPKDASQLRQPEYRQRVAESLYKGVARYAGGLSGVRPPVQRASVR